MADEDTFELEIATAERVVLREAARVAQIPAAAGYIGMLPGHAPLIGALGAGELSFERPDGKLRRLVVGGGFLELQPRRAVLLADTAEWPEQIDPARAIAALERAEELQRSTDAAVDHDAAARDVQLARARLASRQRYTDESVKHS